MNHHEIDPSLRAAEPLLESLADGFSPPDDWQAAPAGDPEQGEPADAALSPKSPF